jgi:hypothetical protein
MPTLEEYFSDLVESSIDEVTVPDLLGLILSGLERY